MKKIFLLVLLTVLLTPFIYAQPERIGGGLVFATEHRFNGGQTGNPGLNVKTWIALDKRKTFHLVPSVTVFNPLDVTSANSVYVTTTYLFHGDLDLHYKVFHDKTIKLVALAGMNFSYISSKNFIYVPLPPLPTDSITSGFGPELGASLEMRMTPYIDLILTGKYAFTGIRAGDVESGEKFLVAPLGAPIIQLHVAYYFVSRGRGYSRR